MSQQLQTHYYGVAKSSSPPHVALCVIVVAGNLLQLVTDGRISLSEINRFYDVAIKYHQSDFRPLTVCVKKMSSERKFQSKHRRLVCLAAHAPAGVQDKNQSMGARVGR